MCFGFSRSAMNAAVEVPHESYMFEIRIKFPNRDNIYGHSGIWRLTAVPLP